MSTSTLPLLILPFAAPPGEDARGLWARQLARQLADELQALDLEVFHAPTVARDDAGGVHWWVREEPWRLEDAPSLAPQAPDLWCVLGWLVLREGELELQVVVERQSTGARVVEAHFAGRTDQAREGLRALRDAIAQAAGVPHEVPLICDAWTTRESAFEALLADADLEGLRAAGGTSTLDPWRFLRLALEADPQALHPRGLWVARALDAVRGGDRDRGLAALHERLEEDGDSADLLGALAEAFSIAKRFDEAEETFRRAIALDPGFAWAHFRLASLRMLVEDWASAVALLRRAALLEPAEARIRQQLGVALAELGEVAEAEQVWGELLADPTVSEEVRQVIRTGQEMLKLRAREDAERGGSSDP